MSANLKEAIPSGIKSSLTPAEERLLDFVSRGEALILSTGTPEADKPENSTGWGPDRTIRSELIQWLCTSKDAFPHLHPKGIRVIGAKISGDLDFENSRLSHALILVGCRLGKVDITNAETCSIALSGSLVESFCGDGARIRGDLNLRDKFNAQAGIRLLGADIEGDFSCNGANLSTRDPNQPALNADGISVRGSIFMTRGFQVKGELRLPAASIGLNFECSGGKFDNGENTAIHADGISVKGNVFLDEGFHAIGKVRLLSASIGRDLSCELARFESPNGVAINGDTIRINGSIYFRNGFESSGEIRLVGASVSGTLECSGAKLSNPDGVALGADRITIGGSAFLDEGLTAKGEVRLLGANIGSDLSCRKGRFENGNKYALNLDGITIKGSMYLTEGFSAAGQVWLIGATIGGTFGCRGGTFSNPGGVAFYADRACVKGSVFLDQGFVAYGEVRFPGAEIGSDLACGEAIFKNPGGVSLIGDGVSIRGNLILGEGFSSEGLVRFLSATVGGSVLCSRGAFHNAGNYAFVADRIDVKGNIELDKGFKAQGCVRFSRAAVGCDFIVDEAAFEYPRPGEFALGLENARISNVLRVQRMAPSVSADLTGVRTGTLIDDMSAWPAGRYSLEGFEYGRIGTQSSIKLADRLGWLRNQLSRYGFRTQPYQHLAAAYRSQGLEAEARQTLIAMHQDHRRSGELSREANLVNVLLDITIRYGYESWRVVFFAALFISLGWLIFSDAARTGALACADESCVLRDTIESSLIIPLGPKIASGMTAGKPRPQTVEIRTLSSHRVYRELWPSIYSLDSFLPIIDLHQKAIWAPDLSNKWGWCVQVYLWIHIALGWILTTLAVAGFTGLVRKE